jgi:hypothetical protein
MPNTILTIDGQGAAELTAVRNIDPQDEIEIDYIRELWLEPEAARRTKLEEWGL